MNAPKDSVLAEYAKRLRDGLKWPELPGFDHDAYFSDPDTRWKNMSLAIDKKHIAVRVRFNGRQRTLGIFKLAREAARFADLCILRFSKYRQRKNIPVDSDFNFNSEKLAQQDHDFLSEAHPEIIDILDGIESHFIATGVFLPFDPDAAEKRAKEKRRTVASRMTHVVTEFYDEILDRQTIIARDVKRLEEKIDQILTILNQPKTP